MDTVHSHPSGQAQAAFHPSTPLPPLPRDVPSSTPSHQQRLLRTRNARFSAKRISISGISARFSDMIKTNEDRARSQPTPKKRNQENTQSTKPQTPSQPGPPASSISRGGHLEEVSNPPFNMVRSHSKLASVPIFQDYDQGSLSQRSPFASPTVYQDPISPDYTQPTSDSPSGTHTAMALKEISGNARKSPITVISPYNSGTARRPASFQVSRFNSEQYIEHLERHLALVKIDAYSPESKRPWKEKLKAAEAEKERLKLENQQMKTSFEAELQKTVEHMTATEVELRRRIRSLENDLEQKDVAIQELEMQHEERRLDQSTLDTLRSTIDKLEQEKRSLEQCNKSILKRNETLTQLLAISPTKTHDPLQPSSPVRTSRKARPQSLMIPKLPSSPDAASWGLLGRSTTPTSSPPPVQAFFSPSRPRIAQTTPFPPAYYASQASHNADNASHNPSLEDQDHLAPLSRVNCSHSNATYQSLMGPTSCSLPLDEMINHDQSRLHTKNRARRFLPGSTGLKPLLLPSLTSENGALRPASPTTSPIRQIRDFPETSTDPNAMLLSQSPPHTIAFSHRTSSASTAIEDTIRKLLPPSLMSTSEQPGAPENALETDCEPESSPSQAYASISGLDTGDIWSSHPEQAHPSRAISPDFLNSVEVPLPLFSPSVSVRQHTCRRQLLRRQNSSDELGIEISTPSHRSRRVAASSMASDAGDPSTPHGFLQQDDSFHTVLPITPKTQITAAESESNSNPSRSSPTPSSPSVQPRNLFEILYKYGASRSLTTVTLTAIYRAWSRYRTGFTVIRRSPLALARRVMANAWQARWAICGMMSWWVLGLFLGPFWRYGQQPSSGQHDPYPRHVSGTCEATHSPDEDMNVEICSDINCAHNEEETSSYQAEDSPGWTRRLFLWGKFSITIMMAIGGAVVQGPGEMLREADERSITVTTGCSRKDKAQTGHALRAHLPSPALSVYSETASHCSVTKHCFGEDDYASSPLTGDQPHSKSFPSGPDDDYDGHNDGDDDDDESDVLDSELPEAKTDYSELSTFSPEAPSAPSSHKNSSDRSTSPSLVGLGISIPPTEVESCDLKKPPLLSEDMVEGRDSINDH